jgi:23S rRNA pseudouridine1911/1915/1917 synthase
VSLLVHVDPWLAVVEKPAGLVVHPAPGHRGPTLVDEVRHLIGGGPRERPGIVHRLDRDTSGLILVARGEEPYRRLTLMIRERRVSRVYMTLVEGRLRSRTGAIDAPLGRDRRAPQRRAVRGRGARQARTHFRVIELLPADTFVEARLETGRTHQIRAHFAAIGHPVCADSRYGHAGRHGLGRQFLHSARLAFVHPFTERELEFRSELPDDLAEALERARRG